MWSFTQSQSSGFQHRCVYMCQYAVRLVTDCASSTALNKTQTHTLQHVHCTEQHVGKNWPATRDKLLNLHWIKQDEIKIYSQELKQACIHTQKDNRLEIRSVERGICPTVESIMTDSVIFQCTCVKPGIKKDGDRQLRSWPSLQCLRFWLCVLWRCLCRYKYTYFLT